MISCVLDGSVALGWVLPDESTEGSTQALYLVEEFGAAVTSIWAFEVAHALIKAERRKRISKTERVDALRFLAQFRIEPHPTTTEHAWGAVLALAEQHQLSAYDASYLELAIRLSAPLATRDEALARAAATAGVSVLF